MTHDSRRRSLFQIHLSTAVLMMIAAGVVIWANVRKRDVVDRHTAKMLQMVSPSGGAVYESRTCYGWPANAMEVKMRGSAVAIPKGLRGADYYERVPHWNVAKAAGNAFLGLMLIAAVWAISELSASSSRLKKG